MSKYSKSSSVKVNSFGSKIKKQKKKDSNRIDSDVFLNDSQEYGTARPIMMSMPYTGSELNQIKQDASITRLMSINEAFEILRKNIPTFPYERRLSKIDTLHLTISYINLLESVIRSKLSLYDYLQISVSNWMSSSYQKSYSNNDYMENDISNSRPIWATSDLTVRLNWLNWPKLGIFNEHEIRNFLDLFKFFGDLNRDKLL